MSQSTKHTQGLCSCCSAYGSGEGEECRDSAHFLTNLKKNLVFPTLQGYLFKTPEPIRCAGACRVCLPPWASPLPAQLGPGKARAGQGCMGAVASSYSFWSVQRRPWYWFVGAALTGGHKLGGPNNRNLSSHGPGGQQSAIKVAAGLAPSGGCDGDWVPCPSPSF